MVNLASTAWFLRALLAYPRGIRRNVSSGGPEVSEETTSVLVAGVDIGGTGIKAAPVHVATGELAAERIRLPTPSPATPQAVASVVSEVLRHIDVPGPVGLAIPAVVRGGIVETASHIDQTWIGVNAADFFSKVTGRPVAVITLGTGIGSALFTDGALVPNSELGHLPLLGGTAEQWAAESVRERDQVPWEEYASRLQTYLELVQQVLWPQLIIIGGGISNVADKFLPLIQLRTPIVPARLRNHAGIIGAAMFAPRE